MAESGLAIVEVPQQRHGAGKRRHLVALFHPEAVLRATWESGQVASGDADALAAAAEAERIFRQERARGGSTFRVEPDKPAIRIEEFEPQAGEIIIVPRMAGPHGSRFSSFRRF